MMLTSARGGRGGQLSDGCGRVESGSAVGPDGGQDQDGGFIQCPAPGIAVAAGRPGGAAVVGASFAELAEGNGVAAGFGQEVPAVAEHVRPGPATGSGPGAAELPGGGDEPPVVGGAAQVLDVTVLAEPLGGQAGGGEGLGGVLGDVVGDGLAVQRLAGAGQGGAVPDDAGVGLRAEPSVTAWPSWPMARLTAAAAWPMASHSMSAVMPSGGGW